MPLLEPIMKGLIEWIYEMVVGIMEYAAKELVGVMSMDMAYFEQTAPVIKDITNIILALGWGMLIANMVFQSTKAMMSGVGFESEDPKHIFCRTFVFAFLLLASKQICNLAMGITENVIELLQIPSALDFSIPDQSMFDISSSVKWLIVIVVGFILIFQYIKLLFEIGERYVVTSVLTFFSPLAFAMGGSKNTNDIFKGWCRMYGSMMVMMIMNIVFLKLILSAMGNVTKGSVLIWLVFVVALTRVARKIDSHIGKIGLNPAQTGDGVGSRLPGMMTMVAVRTMASTIGRNISSNRDSARHTSSNGSGPSHSRYNSRSDRSHTNNNTEHTRPSGSSARGNAGTTVNTSSGSSTSSSQQTRNSQSVSHNGSKPNGQYRGKDRYGIPYMDVNEQYGKFLNGNPEAHTGRGSVNSVGGVNRESLSRTNDLRSADGNKTGAGINNSPSHQNRPPISRNTVVGENRNNVGSVNQEQNASHFNSQRQSSVAGNSPTNVTQRGNSTNNSGTVHNTENVRNGINTVNSSEGQTHSVVNNHNNTTTGGTNNNSHTDNVSRQQTVNNNRQINHEYKNGRYNPAAVNRKQDRTVYHKQTTIKKIDSSDEMKLRKKRGGKNGRTKK